MVIYKQEHEILPDKFNPYQWNELFNGKQLFKWTEPLKNGDSWSYKTYYRIGAEWINEENALVVTTRQNLENIDFVSMFMSCFNSDIEQDRFSTIYDIDFNKPRIKSKVLCNVLNPLIVIHFLTIVERIVSKGLKKDYMTKNDNIHKVKGRIKLIENERKNVVFKRFDWFSCQYDEFTLDNYQNRLIKKALVFLRSMVHQMRLHRKYDSINSKYIKCLSAFDDISDQVEFWEVGNIKTNKLFPEYNEAIRLAKLILKRCDYSVTKDSDLSEHTPPFWIDMSLLFELYVYGLLRKTYGDSVKYQEGGVTGYPDFLFVSNTEKLVMDTKYIPRFANTSNNIDTYIVRQLSGYSRDNKILNRLGYNIENPKSIPVVPCVIIYPCENSENTLPQEFDKNKTILEQSTKDDNLLFFYRLRIALPINNAIQQNVFDC